MENKEWEERLTQEFQEGLEMGIKKQHLIDFIAADYMEIKKLETNGESPVTDTINQLIEQNKRIIEAIRFSVDVADEAKKQGWVSAKLDKINEILK